MHDPHFALDIDILVIHAELSPDENHDGSFKVWSLNVFFVCFLGGAGVCYVSLSARAGAEVAPFGPV